VVDREREIVRHQATRSYTIQGEFRTQADQPIQAQYAESVSKKEEVYDKFTKRKGKDYIISDVTKKP
jgi:DNA topoisomerase IA